MPDRTSNNRMAPPHCKRIAPRNRWRTACIVAAGVIVLLALPQLSAAQPDPLPATAPSPAQPAATPPSTPAGGPAGDSRTGSLGMPDRSAWAASFGMGPPVTPEIVAAAAAATTPLADGPFDPTWASIRALYHVPQWFTDAKFGIFLHWGVYAVPAYHNEWYEKHVYAAFADWHAQRFGPQDRFGYKDFIPLFTAEKFNPDEWAVLFMKAGAKYIIPTAEHHDGFSLWDSDLNRWNALRRFRLGGWQ